MFLWGIFSRKVSVMKRIALITDISGLGNCSANANISILSAMGMECCFIPTAVLSAQTGFRNYSMIDCSDSLDSFFVSFKRINPSFDAIYSGFLANAAQADFAGRFISEFKNENTVVFADPIMGDNGNSHSFYSERLKFAISEIVSMSTVITPNLTELCLLTDTDYHTVDNLEDEKKFSVIDDLCCRLLNDTTKAIVVTGILDHDGNIVNLTAKKGVYQCVSSKRFGTSYSGTGDIFTSVLCGSMLRGESVFDAAKKASDFVCGVLEESFSAIDDRNYGIPFQKYLPKLFA